MSDYTLCWTCKLQRATEHTPLGSHCLSCTLGFVPTVTQDELDAAARVKAEYAEAKRAEGMRAYMSKKQEQEHTAERLFNLYTADEKAMTSYEEHALGWDSDLRAIVDSKILAWRSKNMREECLRLNEELPALREEMKGVSVNLQNMIKMSDQMKEKTDKQLELASRISDFRGFDANKKKWFLRRVAQALSIEENEEYDENGLRDRSNDP